MLRLVNPAGQELLGAPAERLLGRSAGDVGLCELLEGEDERVLDAVYLVRLRFDAGRIAEVWSVALDQPAVDTFWA